MASHIAAIQMVSGNDLEANLASAAALMRQAADSGAQLLVLPETFAMFRASAQEELGKLEAAGEGLIRPFLQQQARELGVWIVGGTIPIASEEHKGKEVHAACLLVDDQGREVVQYNKIHMFDVDVDDEHGSYRESDTFLPGSDAIVVDTPFGRLGLAVCYDIRFPELFRMMFDQSVDLIAVPSAFTLHTGEAHWLPLLRARAIENQCYIIGANQGGQHSSRRSTSGGSVIIDGWGNILAEAARGESVVEAMLDLETLHQQRKTMPCHQHRRFNTVAK